MTPSQACFDVIKRFEGCRLDAYLDPVGIPTIGYGHTKGVKVPMSCTQEQADEWLKEDAQGAADCVNRRVGPVLTQEQFDALVSFTFNVGCHNFATSTMARLLNAGEYDNAANEFLKWDHAGGVVLPGLLNRRLAEMALFRGGDGVAAA